MLPDLEDQNCCPPSKKYFIFESVYKQNLNWQIVVFMFLKPVPEIRKTDPLFLVVALIYFSCILSRFHEEAHLPVCIWLRIVEIAGPCCTIFKLYFIQFHVPSFKLLHSPGHAVQGSCVIIWTRARSYTGL